MPDPTDSDERWQLAARSNVCGPHSIAPRHPSTDPRGLTMLDINNLPPTISVPEAAELLGVGRDLGYQMAADGTLPVLRLGTRLRVASAAIRRMLEVTE